MITLLKDIIPAVFLKQYIVFAKCITEIYINLISSNKRQVSNECRIVSNSDQDKHRPAVSVSL